jgi:hypothetical protein
MLALQAPKPYAPPGDDGVDDLGAHLTNTCLQDGLEDNVHLFSDFIGKDSTSPGRSVFTAEDVASVQAQIYAIASDLFKAALGSGSLFQVCPASSTWAGN